MAQRVTRVRGHSKQKKVDRPTKAERKARSDERKKRWVEHCVGQARALIEMLLEEDVAELLGRPAHQWGDRTERVEVNACCNDCGRNCRGWFRRNGSCPRSLVLEGLVVDFRVPRLRCGCGGTVHMSFSMFVPYERVSPEMAERLREAVALFHSEAGLELRVYLTLLRAGKMLTAGRDNWPRTLEEQLATT